MAVRTQRYTLPGVRLQPWGPGDLELLVRLVGDPEMMEHLGGPEDAEQIAKRQARYEQPGSGCFAIVAADGQHAGWVGYWDREWREAQVFEMGWSVLPERQGEGLATRGCTLALAQAAAEDRHEFAHAFPAVDNIASNALCARVGFELVETVDFEYPPGQVLRCNSWRCCLRAAARG
jgi:RimJ/RimL family protein N-acetyltransferase